MIRFYVRVSGTVQCVGFRYFVSQNANLFSLTGWVRNLNNGDVDMEIQGTDADISAFLDNLRDGNRYAEVENIDMKQLDIIHESSFQIVDWF